MGPGRRARRVLLSAATAAALMVGGLVPATAAPAPTLPAAALPAATWPAEPGVPEGITKVGTEPLPTVQINGVAWTQLVVGTTVYVGGEFTSARPAGAPAGTSEVPRSNLLAYNVQTGALIGSFNPQVNAQVKDLAVSPDGATLYAAGSFTQVDGQTRYRVAAFSTATGELTSFRPTVNATINAVEATNTTVYLGGIFSTLNGAPRVKVGAVTAASGATLPFEATIDNRSVQAMAIEPSGGSIVIGGNFTSVNGSSNPGYGLARLDGATGAMLPLPVNAYARNAGDNGAILHLSADDENFYGSGYHYSNNGNIEGTFAGTWDTGDLSWVDDCHGDTYGAFPFEGAVYQASHKHYCGNSGDGFPQTDPQASWSYNRGTALTIEPTLINRPDIYGYPDHDGEPGATQLNWYPNINAGSYTGKNQGPWSVAAGAGYVVYGGEFTRVNNIPQQGLVRFASTDIRDETDGPVHSGDNFPVRAVSPAAGTVSVSWRANYDRNDEELTYRLYRSSTNQPAIYEETVRARFWRLPTLNFIDTGLTPGSEQRYRVVVRDAAGNEKTSSWATVTVAGSGTLGEYAAQVLGDGASAFWRLDETTGATLVDTTGLLPMAAGTGSAPSSESAIDGDAGGARTFDGTVQGSAGSTAAAAYPPAVFSTEAWFRTTTTRGGKILGFGTSASGSSSRNDRHIYMDNSGRLLFGVQNNARNVVASTGRYNDGEWHHVVATLSQAGMQLYVDGARVAKRDDVINASAWRGYWRLGGDNLSSWSSAPTSHYFAGTIDEAAVYEGTALTLDQVREHYDASGRALAPVTAPADDYGAEVFSAGPDFYWRFSEDEGTTVADSGPFRTPGTATGNVVRGVPGALAGVDDPAIETTGSGGHVFSTGEVTNPQEFAAEAWFSTSSTSGGKIIGFGNRQTGTSNNYDRHVYMRDDGRLVFGVYTGQENTVLTDAAFNDGAWHHVVASQELRSGMRLYVDGELVGTNPQIRSQNYAGFWRVGGDTTWSGASSAFLIGSFDEVAVYPRALTAEEVALHHDLGATDGPVNQAPTAAFTHEADGLAVTLDASGSTDPDGEVASYAWDFGDGEQGTGAQVEHTYGAAGTYTVTLTVTDDGGATDEQEAEVTVTAPPVNQAPTAAFTHE
ncbi:PKD domain-containing protein, partial [Flavimobilis marinus]